MVHVHSDSVFWLGRVCHPSEANGKCENPSSVFQQSKEYAELSGIDGEPIKFEWKYYPRIHIVKFSDKIQKYLEARQINPEQFEGQKLFISMFNDIDWRKNGNSSEYISNYKQVCDHAKKFQRGHWSFFGHENEENGMGRTLTNQKGNLSSSNKVVSHIPEVQVRSTEEYWSENQGDTLQESKIELTSSQIVGMLSDKEYVQYVIDLKIGWNIIGKPKMSLKCQEKRFFKNREKMENGFFTSRNPTATWVDSRVLHLSGKYEATREDETRRCAFCRWAARQAFIHGSTTKHKASTMQLSTCETKQKEVPSRELLINKSNQNTHQQTRSTDSGVSPLSLI